MLGSPMVGSDVYIEASGAGPMIPKIIGQAKAESRLAVVALHKYQQSITLLVVVLLE